MAIQDFYEDLIVMEKRLNGRDEYGSPVYEWVEVFPFKGTFVVSSSVPVIVAERYGNKAMIQIDTDKLIKLPLNTYIKRVADEKVCRTVSLPNDYDSPGQSEAVLDICYYLCERAVLD